MEIAFSAPPAVADRQWHSFGGSSGGRGPTGEPAQAGPSSNAGGFHVFSGNRSAASTGTVRSFSGQGGEVWENAPAARNVVPRSQSLATLHSSFSGSRVGSSVFRSDSTLTASSRFGGSSLFASNRGFSGGVNTANTFQHLHGAFGPGNQFTRFDRFNRFNRFNGFGGCWNCGFGLGFGFGGFGFGGWGFGSPWLGFGLWDPFWYSHWWGPGPAYGYGYYGYPDANVYPIPMRDTPLRTTIRLHLAAQTIQAIRTTPTAQTAIGRLPMVLALRLRPIPRIWPCLSLST